MAKKATPFIGAGLDAVGSLGPYGAAAAAVGKFAMQQATSRREEDHNGLDVSARDSRVLTVSFTAATAGSPQKVLHGLGRVPVGYSICCRMADERVWDAQASDEQYFYLEASGAVDIKMKVW